MDIWCDYWPYSHAYSIGPLSRSRQYAFRNFKTKKNNKVSKVNKYTRYRRGCWR